MSDGKGITTPLSVPDSVLLQLAGDAGIFYMDEPEVDFVDKSTEEAYWLLRKIAQNYQIDNINYLNRAAMELKQLMILARMRKEAKDNESDGQRVTNLILKLPCLPRDETVVMIVLLKAVQEEDSLNNVLNKHTRIALEAFFSELLVAMEGGCYDDSDKFSDISIRVRNSKELCDQCYKIMMMNKKDFIYAFIEMNNIRGLCSPKRLNTPMLCESSDKTTYR